LPRKGHEALADKLKLPKFASEAEEAQWWYDHREEVTKAFEDAAARGELLTGSAVKLAGQPGTGVTPATTIQLDPQDISRARVLAAKRVVRYQTYLKSSCCPRGSCSRRVKSRQLTPVIDEPRDHAPSAFFCGLITKHLPSKLARVCPARISPRDTIELRGVRVLSKR
jgi:hypothetical protein